MTLAVEDVYQALVLSSIFLMAISLPRVILYMVWSWLRLYILRNMDEIDTAKQLLSKKSLQKSLTAQGRLKMLADETNSFMRDFKKPVAEMISAEILLPLSASRLQVEPGAWLAIYIIEVAMVAVTIAMAGTFYRRVREMQRMRGGGPIA